MPASPACASRTPLLAAGLLALALAGCGTAGTPFDPRSTAGEEMAVQETVIRFVTGHFRPRARAGAPAAWCLAVGRRVSRALNPARRGEDETYVPGQRLLQRLRDISPPVVPVSDCGVDESQQERLSETGEPAILLLISHPIWETQQNAIVELYTRETPNDVDGARCRLVRGVEGWRIRDCV